MFSENQRPGRVSRWQAITVVIVLFLLAISALPNVYQDKAVLLLSTNSIQTASPSLIDVNEALLKHGISVDTMSEQDEGIQIELTSMAQQKQAKKHLENKFGHDFTIESSITSAAPVWLRELGLNKIKLGLDLSGGVLFLLDVDVKQALSEHQKNVVASIGQLIVENKIRGVRITKTGDLSFKVISTYQPNTAQAKDLHANKVQKLYKEIQQQFPHWVKSRLNGDNHWQLSEEGENQFRLETMQQTLKTMRGRIEELGITEAITQKQGKNRIRIELPGVHDPEKAKRIIGATASLAFYQMQENNHSASSFTIDDDRGVTLRLASVPIFTGNNIKHAQSGRDQLGMPLVNLKLDSLGGNKMSAFSKNNIGNPLVTVYSEYYRDADNQTVKKSEVLSVATVQQHLGAQFSLTNLSSPDMAQELALVLRAGSLNAPVTIVKERTIEAKLGAENISNGIKSLVIGLSATLVFMLLFYRKLGFVANAALILNLVALLGMISLLPGAVLTLPGIAGLVLTVGMAVDTNVLIFERIKEELKRGKGKLVAVERGYSKAVTTILDANITTLLTGIILYSVGYGPIKGFALILCLGILTSLLTGVFVSKLLTQLTFSQKNTRIAKA